MSKFIKLQYNIHVNFYFITKLNGLCLNIDSKTNAGLNLLIYFTFLNITLQKDHFKNENTIIEKAIFKSTTATKAVGI